MEIIMKKLLSVVLSVLLLAGFVLPAVASEDVTGETLLRETMDIIESGEFVLQTPLRSIMGVTNLFVTTITRSGGYTAVQSTIQRYPLPRFLFFFPSSGTSRVYSPNGGFVSVQHTSRPIGVDFRPLTRQSRLPEHLQALVNLTMPEEFTIDTVSHFGGGTRRRFVRAQFDGFSFYYYNNRLDHIVIPLQDPFQLSATISVGSLRSVSDPWWNGMLTVPFWLNWPVALVMRLTGRLR